MYNNFYTQKLYTESEVAELRQRIAALEAQLSELKAENTRNLVAWRTSEQGYKQMREWRDVARRAAAAWKRAAKEYRGFMFSNEYAHLRRAVRDARFATREGRG